MFKRWTRFISFFLSCCFILQIFAGAETGLFSSDRSKRSDSPRETTTRILIKYKEGFSWKSIEKSYERQQKKPKNIRTGKHSPLDVVTVTSVSQTKVAIDTLNALPEVEYAVADTQLEAFSISEGSWNTYQHAQLAQACGFTGKDVLVGVLDTGVDISHPFIQHNIFQNEPELDENGADEDQNGYIDDLCGWDFVHGDPTIFDGAEADRHGTAVAGLIISMAPDVQILPLKFMEGNVGYVSDAIEAIAYAEQMGVKILNCSWGSPVENIALQEAIANSEMLFVCAGGNKQEGDVQNTAYPSAWKMPNVISVGAIDPDGKITDFTTGGSTHDLFAPGVEVPSIAPSGSFGAYTGTSFAAATVTGLAALALQAAPALHAEVLAMCLRQGYNRDCEIPVAEAQSLFTQILPYATLQDPDGCVSKIIGLYGDLLPADIVRILVDNCTWEELASEEQTRLVVGFRLKEEDAPLYTAAPVRTAIYWGLLSDRASISIAKTQELAAYYADDSLLYTSLLQMANVHCALSLTEAEKDTFVDLLQTGYSASDLGRALLFARATSRALNEVVGDIYTVSASFSDEDQWSLLQIMQHYHVCEAAVLAAMREYAATPTELLLRIFSWQEEQHLSLENDVQNAYSYDPTPDYFKSDFYKYKVRTEDVWVYDALSVEKDDGMVSYYQPLVNIAARGGNSLTFGLRFDPEVADAVALAPSLGDASAPQNYVVKTTRQGYRMINDIWVPEGNPYVYTQTITSEDAFNLKFFQQLNHTELLMDEDFKAVTSVSVMAYTEIDSTYQAQARSNLYDDLYGFGVGIGTNMPLIEIEGANMYLHLGSGSKYSVQCANETYSLKDYYYKDMELKSDSSFSANGLFSCYALEYISGVTEYFSAEGKYLGRKDLSNNRTEVWYTSEGKLDRIVEPAGRYLSFVYSTNGNTRTTEIWLNDNAAGGTSAQRLYTVVSTRDNTTNAYFLEKIVDAVGQNTTFVFDTYTYFVRLNVRTTLNVSRSFTHTGIVPTAIYDSSKTNKLYYLISYESATRVYGGAGIQNYKRAARIAKSSAATFNGELRGDTVFSYKCGIDTAQQTAYTTYWMCKPQDMLRLDSEIHGYNSATVGAQRQEYRFSMYGFGESLTLYANDSAIEKTTYSLDSYGQLSALTFSGYSPTAVLPLESTAYTRDQYRNVLSSTTQKSDFMYHLSTYVFDKSENIYTYTQSKTIPTTEVSYTGKSENGYWNKILVCNTVDAAKNRITNQLTYAIEDIYNTNMTSPMIPMEFLSRTEYTYDTYGNVTMIKTTDGATGNTTYQNFGYDNKYNAYVTSVIEPGLVDADGNYTVWPVMSADYNKRGDLLWETNENGHKTGYTYDAIGNRLSTSYYEKSGSSQIFRYADYVSYQYPQRIVTNKPYAQPWTKTCLNSFSEKVSVQESTDLGVTYTLLESYTYTARGQIAQSKTYTTDGRYTRTDYTYDWNSRVLSEISGSYSSTHTRLAFLSHTEWQYTSDSGQQEWDTYMTSREVHKRIIVLTRDEDGNVLTKTMTYSDGLNDVQSYTWLDPAVPSSVYSLGYTVYEFKGRPMYKAGEPLVDSGYTYDMAGRLVEKTEGNDPTGTVQYTGLGRVEKSVTEENRRKGLAASPSDEYKYATLRTYDLLGRLIKEEVPFSELSGTLYYKETRYYYDARDNLLKTRVRTNTPGAADSWITTEYAYNFQDQLVMTRVVGEEGVTEDMYTQYVYDLNGNKVREYTGLHAPLTLSYSYGADGSVTVQSLSGNDLSYSMSSYEYDIHGNQTAYVDPLGHRETREYDDQNRLIAQILRNGKTYRYTYDDSGHLTHTAVGTTANGVFTQTAEIQCGYDVLGRMISMVDSQSTEASPWTFTYDTQGRLTTETMPGGYTATYIYNTFARTEYTLKRNNTVLEKLAYTYDDRHQLTRVTDALNYTDMFPDRVNFLEYTYDLDGRVATRKIGQRYNGQYIQQNYEYNYAGLVTTIFNYQYTNRFSLFSYSYRLDGSLSGKIEDGPSTLYTYNALGQLVAETGNEPANYSYDDSGNRVSMMKALPPVTTTYTYDAADRLTSSTVGDSVATYTYDANGNMLTETLDGTLIKSFSYDEFDRLVEAYVAGVTETYTYDGRGRRFSVQNGSTVTRHIWDGDEITYDRVAVGSAETGYNYLHGLSAEGFIIGATIYENVLTAQGDVAATYQNTTQVKNTSYGAFGNAIGSNSSSSSIRNPYGYRGEYTDATGLQYLRARYYDPTLGRFTQQDTMPDQGNPYVYCGNNPVLYRDPSGHCKRWGIPDVETAEEYGIAQLMDLPEGIEMKVHKVSYGVGYYTEFRMKPNSDPNRDLCAGWREHYRMTHDKNGRFIGKMNPYYIKHRMETRTLNSEDVLRGIVKDISLLSKGDGSEQAVLDSCFFSVYRNKLVIRINYGRSGSFGTIFLTRIAGSFKAPEDIVRHEYGHTVQLKHLGVIRFALAIGLPSWQEWGNEKSYYDRPWEITADIFGGVQSREHTDFKIKRGFDYLLTSKHSVLKSWLSIYDEDE